MEELLDLIALVYWHNEDDCIREFDANSEGCGGGGRGSCNNFKFCKKFSEAKTTLEVQRLAKEIKELDDARCRCRTH